MKSKRIAALGLGAGLLVGAGASLVANLPGGAGASSFPAYLAQDDGTETTVATESTTDDSTTAADEAFEPGDRLRDVLAPLVEDGTLTDDQVDAIVDELAASRPAGDGMGHRGPDGHRGPGGPGRGGPGLETAAEVIGISVEDLHTALHDGQTIAEVAEANGVDPQAVIDALVAEAETRITTMVNEGPQRPVDDTTTDESGS